MILFFKHSTFYCIVCNGINFLFKRKRKKKIKTFRRYTEIPLKSLIIHNLIQNEIKFYNKLYKTCLIENLLSDYDWIRY